MGETGKEGAGARERDQPMLRGGGGGGFEEEERGETGGAGVNAWVRERIRGRANPLRGEGERGRERKGRENW